jgi:hypothetical protein
VLGLRPHVIVEIGVWMGGSLIPMAIAQREIVRHELAISPDPWRVPMRHTYAIDPWTTAASVQGQEGANKEWWSLVDHAQARAVFEARLQRHQLDQPYPIVRTLAQPSDDVQPGALGTLTKPNAKIDLLHIDGNHAAQAARDVERFAPCVRLGGILVLDDVGWEGDHVRRGVQIARDLGFAELYPLDTGLILQRTGSEAR